MTVCVKELSSDRVGHVHGADELAQTMHRQTTQLHRLNTHNAQLTVSSTDDDDVHRQTTQLHQLNTHSHNAQLS